jgi:hypothetical protein
MYVEEPLIYGACIAWVNEPAIYTSEFAEFAQKEP